MLIKVETELEVLNNLKDYLEANEDWRCILSYGNNWYITLSELDENDETIDWYSGVGDGFIEAYNDLVETYNNNIGV